MNIFHIDLEKIEDLLTYHCFWNSPENLKTHQISLQKPAIDLANPKATGKSLYQWLNGPDGILDQQIKSFKKEGNCMIAIYGAKELPWELLHDEVDFLANQKPALLPVRCYKSSNPRNEFAALPIARLNVFLLSSEQWLPPLEKSQLELTRSDLISQLWQSAQTREKNYYDMIHLCGEISQQNGQVYFREFFNAAEIAERLKDNFPKLILFSGTWPDNALVTQIAQDLLELGAQCILTIRENQSSIDTFYLELSKGNSLLDSLMAAHGKGNFCDLRLHVMGNLPGSLVDQSLITNEYILDRQILLDCRQSLTISSKAQRGLIIGEANSRANTTYLSKLLPRHQNITCSRRLSASNIVAKLTQFQQIEYDKSAEFKYQLRDIFRHSTDNNYLFIFDEFEWNLNFKNDKYSLKIETEDLLKSMLWAIREGSFAHRIILASDYEFTTNLAHSFYLLPKSSQHQSLDHTETIIDSNILNILKHCAVYEIPVPISALEYICSDLPDHQNNIKQAIEQGLIEEINGLEKLYNVPTILPQLVPALQLDKESLFYYNLSSKAAKFLTGIWLKKENEDPQKWHELFRLFLANKNNTDRFKEAFLAMLSIQYNTQADIAYEQQLRLVREQLPKAGMLVQLEAFLKQGNYRQADVETAWIFYQIMIFTRSRGFKELHEQLSCELLLELDRLWLKYSKGLFGFSKQNEIFKSLEKKEDQWEHFGQQVGWKVADQWLDYESLAFNLNAKPANLPALYTTGAYTGGWGTVGLGLGWSQPWVLARRLSSIFAKLDRCRL